MKVKEFKLPGKEAGVASIIVGPDHNLWFTGWRSIFRMTTGGKMAQTFLKKWQSDPGNLTVGSDGNIWANTAQFGPSYGAHTGETGSRTYYSIYKVTPQLQRFTYGLPPHTNLFPTNLVRSGSDLYFGYPTITSSNGSTVDSNWLASISPSGKITTLFDVHYKQPGGAGGWINVIETGGPKFWLYDYHGDIEVCTLQRKCSFRSTAYPNMYLGSLHPMMMAYSPVAQSVYLTNLNVFSIFQLPLTGGRKKVTNVDIAAGGGAIAYYDKDIWVALGPDAKGRPKLGRLTPSGKFSEIALPFLGPTQGITALGSGPDGHLWYLRGYHVGEILTP